MFAVPVPPPDSTTSGYSVPCTRNSTDSPAATISRAAASKTRMNSRPMILRFSSGSRDAGERAEEPVLRLDDLEPDAGGGDEVPLDLLGLAGAQQAVIDEDAGELVADRALHERGRDRRVDAAGQPADHLLAADLRTDRVDLLVDDVRLGPGRPRAGDVVEEVPQDRLSVLGVQHLRVELHAGEPAADVLERGDRRARSAGGHGEAGWGESHRVAVAHPDLLCRRQAAQQHARLDDAQRRAAELRAAGARDLAGQRLRHRLEAVADAEDRHAGGEQRGVGLRCSRGVHRRRAAGQDDRLRLAGEQLGDRQRARDDLGVDVRLAHPAGDQLRVLRPVVDDEDEIGVHSASTASMSRLIVAIPRFSSTLPESYWTTSWYVPSTSSKATIACSRGSTIQ